MILSLLSAASAVGAHTLTLDRAVATAASLAALAGAIVGGLALARPAGHVGRRGAAVAVVAGLAGAAVGALILATADGGPGTGNGVVGGYAAVTLGPIAALLGGLRLARSRRTI